MRAWPEPRVGGGGVTRRIAIVLPPREGFSPEAVGAIGLLVHRLSGPDDLVFGRPGAHPPFADRRFVPVAPSGTRLLRGALRYAAAIARTLRRDGCDGIEVHNRPDVACLLARRLPEVPVRLFLHNDPQGMRRAATPAARRHLARRVRIVAVSDWLAARFADRLHGAVPVPVLPNCLDLAALPASPPRRDRVILFAGRLVADKGADCFVRAGAAVLPRLRGWRMEMIGADRFEAGRADTPFERALRHQAEAAGIVLGGYRPHRAVLEAMARAAIVVVPSRWPEPFGLTALEAMACGAALICSGRGGLAALANGAALIVDPEQPGALEAALLRLAADRGLRARLGRAGRERALAYDLPVARQALQALRATPHRHDERPA